MIEELLELIKNLKEDNRFQTFDEAATKQFVILRILKALGWDPFNMDEVYPEYSVGGKRVDYALSHNGKKKVFIEVKKVNEDLEKHQEQLLNYSFQEGVKLAILTNGISWWFYLPLREGSWEQRKFYTIDIFDQEIKDIAEKFNDFLSKENVISDKAIENAENLYKSRQKQDLIKETLPKAWRKIITEPDELLVELLADTTEKLCGYKPDNEIVEQFLIKIAQTSTTQIKKEIPAPGNLPPVQTSRPPLEDYTGQSIVAFIFRGTKYPIRSWKELLITITNLMHTAHNDHFDLILNLVGRTMPYFTKNPNKLTRPVKINNTNIYVETNLSANSIVRLSKKILAHFGYDEKELTIEVR